MGQWVSMGDNERLCYEFTLSEARRRGDRKAVALLERIGAPENGLYRGDWLGGVNAQRAYLKKYGGFLYGKSGVLDLHFGSYLRTTEYRGFSISTYFKAELFCLRALWPAAGESRLVPGRGEIRDARVPLPRQARQELRPHRLRKPGFRASRRLEGDPVVRGLRALPLVRGAGQIHGRHGPDFSQ